MEQPARWNSVEASGRNSWRGSPGMHGRGPQVPEGRERQWGGQGPSSHPQASADPIEISHEQSSKVAEG